MCTKNKLFIITLLLISNFSIAEEAPPAPTISYEPLIVSENDVGNIFNIQTRDMGGSAINYQSRAGVVNIMEQVVDDIDATGYVAIEKVYKFYDKYQFIVSTGEYGMSCPATTYAFTFDTKSESVTGKTQIDGCSESVDSFADGNKLMVKKDGKPSTFYNGETK